MGAYYFDTAAADRALALFERHLVHVKGEWAGTPLKLMPWMVDRIVRPLFGTLRTADGLRRYRNVYVGVPRKNAKSTLAAGVGVKLLAADSEPGAEVYSAAADRDQASIVFDMAKTMVDASPSLSRRLQVFRRSITHPRSASFFKVISADAATKHGYNAHGVIVDELHAHKSAELFDVLTTAQGSRRQPVVFIITTAGWDRLSVCYREYSYAKRVAAGELEDDTTLPVIFEAPADADWKDPDVWAACNPGLGISVKLDYLQAAFRKASESPQRQNVFRRLHLDQWTEQLDRWIDTDVWKENRGPDTIDLDAVADDVEAFGGLDLAATTDVVAWVLAFALPDCVLLLPRFFVPEETIVRRSQADRVPYDRWRDAGWIIATPGNAVDYERVRKQVNEDAQRFRIRQIGYDPWNASQLAMQLLGDGVASHPTDPLVAVRQGFGSMAGPSRMFEQLMLDRRLAHQGNPVLTWMASNVAVDEDAQGNVKPNKRRSSEKIDGIVAAIIAVGRLMVTESGSAYDSGQGLLIL